MLPDVLTYYAMLPHVLTYTAACATHLYSSSLETDDAFLVKSVTLPYRNWLH